MIALGRTRAALIVLSTVAYVLSLDDVGAPIDAQDLAGPSTRDLHVGERPTPPPIEAFVRRDPFAGAPDMKPDARSDARPNEGSPSSSAASGLPLTGDPGDVGDAGDAGDPAVPDIAVGPSAPDADTGSIAGDAVVVRATIVGTRAVAYIGQGDDLQLVRVGDVVAGRRVIAIDLRGISLSDGTRLDLAERTLETPPPRARTQAPSKIDGAVTEIRRLRKFLETRGALAPPQTAPAPMPMAAAHPNDPTPGPMRTVDARGLPVGVNPTPDALAPTAFPYPYPYAPRAY